MKLNFNSVMIGTSDVKKLAEFYEKIFGKPTMAEGGWFGWSTGSTFLTIGAHSEVKGKSKEPQRIIMNFETSEVKEEFKRIKGLGAEVVAEPYNPDPKLESIWIATFADPDGNYFQLMTPWDDGKN